MKWISYNIFQSFPHFRIHRVGGTGVSFALILVQQFLIAESVSLKSLRQLFNSFSSVFSRLLGSRSRSPQKVFKSSSILRQFSSTLSSTQVPSKSIFSSLVHFFNPSSVFSFAVSSRPVVQLRQILETLPKFVEVLECSNRDIANFLKYQWFQSGFNE